MPTALIGGAVSLIGGSMSNKAANKANQAAAQQAEFNPFDINGAGGNVTFGPDGGPANVTGDAQSQQFQQGFGNMFSQLTGGNAANQGAINFGNQVGNNFGGFFDQAGQMGDPSSAVNAANQFTQFSGQDALFGQSRGRGALNQSQQFALQQGGRNEQLAQGMFGQGAQALGNTDFSALAGDQLNRLRAQARPGEDRAVNSKFQNLFSKGILSSTAGQRQIGELALAQEQADIGRSFQADQFANQLGQQNRAFGLQAFGQGQGFRAQDDQFNAQRAGFFGNQGQSLLNFGQQAGGNAMNAQFGVNQLVNSRGQQRLQNAQQMFGFGQQAQAQNFAQANQAVQGSRGLNADLRNLIALGGNLGQAGAQAGANQGAFTSQTGGSAFGEVLGGFGQAIGSGKIALPKFLGGI